MNETFGDLLAPGAHGCAANKTGPAPARVTGGVI